MNQMEIFKNPEFGSIRTFEQDGKVLFCGKDVAQALGYRRPADAIAAHCKGVCVLPTPSNGGIQQMKFIPEGDVYRLIVHSKLPSAERFERWVFDEVLPSIRQHGAYITRDKLWGVATSPEALLKLCTDLLAEREKNAALREDNARLQSKAVYYDLFIDLHHSTNLRTTAKELDVPERRFVRFLLERRFVYHTPSGCVLPYAKSAKDILKLVTTLIANTKGEGKAGDDFWVKAETLLYCALIGYIHYEAPVEEQNFSTLIEMINSMEVREDDEEFKNAVDLMFDELKEREPNHFAVRQYAKYKLAAGKTAKSILVSCGARLAVFDIAELREVTAYDELELDTLGDRRTALFLIMSDTDDSFNFLISMCYTQLFNLLCEKADLL